MQALLESYPFLSVCSTSKLVSGNVVLISPFYSNPYSRSTSGKLYLEQGVVEKGHVCGPGQYNFLQ